MYSTTTRCGRFESPPNGIAWRARRVPMSYGRHVTGRVPVSLAPCVVAYESQLERDVIVFLATFRALRFIESQPFTLHYVDRGRRHRYTPDLLVVLHPVPTLLERLGFEVWTVVEVKPHAELQADGEAIGARLARVGKATGFSAVCLTEHEIERGGRPS